MKVSTRGRYAIQLMLELALQEYRNLSVKSVAEAQNISEKYLEQVIPLLVRGGFVRSVRGAQGGYVLQRDPEKISVGDVLRALEGDITPVACIGIDGMEGGCSSAHTCVTKYVWQRINESVNDTVNHIFLDTLIHESREKQSEKIECPI